MNPKPRSDIAVLVGNGLSIATNKKLIITRITRVVIDILDEAGNTNDPAAQVMQDIAQRLRQKGADANFEALVGPLDDFHDASQMITRLAGLAGDRRLAVEKSLRESATFAQAVRKHVVSHVLEVIATESAARYDKRGPVETFVEATLDAAAGGEVCFGNLNYDSILMAVLVSLYSHTLCDLTDPRKGSPSIELINDRVPVTGTRLRRIADLPRGRRVSLLHLHGSLAWLRDTTTDEFVRVPIDVLRDRRYWKAWRNERTDWEPVVVLTNQTSKARLVKEYPFKMAYDAFYSRLLTADRWLIAGTSLQDEPVNELLQTAWRTRSTVPQVMVVTHGEWPTERQILDAIGYDPVFNDDPGPYAWLNVCRDGIEAAPNSLEWIFWADLQHPVQRVKAG